MKCKPAFDHLISTHTWLTYCACFDSLVMLVVDSRRDNVKDVVYGAILAYLNVIGADAIEEIFDNHPSWKHVRPNHRVGA